VFYATGDYRYYLETLGEALQRYDCQLHSHVLMTNHVHPLVTSLASYGISQMMQVTGRNYVRYINRIYRRRETLWEGRYKASPIDGDGWLLACMRHIEMNPVTAGMLSRPGEYRWSSCTANAQAPAVQP